MILSIWRYCHLSLALVSAIFLIILSITGLILSYYPINDKLSKFHQDELDNITVSSFIKKVQTHHHEIIEINVLKNGFLAVNALDKQGQTTKFYANPKNGENLGELKKESSLLVLSRNIHRSLLWKKNGRIIIGIVSILLFVIAISGGFLVLKKQLSIKNFYSKVIFDDFNKFWHLISGRTFIFFIVIISLTGTIMSLERFEIIQPKNNFFHTIKYDEINDKEITPNHEFKIFKELKLSEVVRIEYPFSSFKEDHYTVKLKTKELIINQYNGAILSSIEFGYLKSFLDTNYNLHTGNGSIIWSVILGVSCLAILFFIYSGVLITIKRRKNHKKNKYDSQESSYLILVGSENGNTNRFAEHVFDTIESNNEKVYIEQLNNYKPLKNIKQLIILTSTYGLGQPPSNAKKFIKKFKKNPLKSSYEYCVVGFGSKNYPDFCKYALDVSEVLNEDVNGKEISEICLINNQSKLEYQKWFDYWVNYNKFESIPTQKEDIHEFRILNKTQAKKDPNNNFKIELKPSRKIIFRSGDLIAFKPPKSNEERYYSIGKNNENNILLSLKKHEQGLCSMYLDELKPKEKIRARIVNNINFHLPIEFDNLVLISNGTGIAPLLGMAFENIERKKVQMYWGAKHTQTLKLYSNIINQLIDDDKITEFNDVYSQSKKHKKMYVQDLIIENQNEFKSLTHEKSYIMICGSKEMGSDVLRTLSKVIGKSKFEQLIDKEQILIDTY